MINGHTEVPRSLSYLAFHSLRRVQGAATPFDHYANGEPWMRDAACLDANPDAWFPGAGALTTENRTAMRVCHSACPVRVECLRYALDHELEGIWGGTTTSQRLTQPTRKESA